MFYVTRGSIDLEGTFKEEEAIHYVTGISIVVYFFFLFDTELYSFG
jgi:hypothetical protein